MKVDKKSFWKLDIIKKQLIYIYIIDSVKDRDKATTIKIIPMTLDVTYWLLNPKTTKQS